MPENLGYQFDRLYAAPIETYRQVNTITNRNAIPPEIRWEGMECYVVTENQDYQLVGGVDNSNWVNAGETVGNPTTHFKGFFNATTVTPAINNINGIEGDEYKVTNGGVNVDFGAGDVFLETDDILIFYQSQWRVKVRVGGNLDDYQLLSEKGEANGYTPLDSGAKVPIEFLPDSLVGQVTYQGAWNASTNTPNVGDATTKKGHYYVTSVAGTYLGISYEVGDWIISNGVEWQKVDNTDAVVSVFGRIGAIVANSSDYAAYYSPIITGGASTIVSANLTANRALVSNGSGKVAVSDITSTELGYLDNVTSNIQTQLNTKLATSSYTAADVLTKLLTVDGSGSGLDADLLDGLHASFFIRTNTTSIKTSGDTIFNNGAGIIIGTLLNSEIFGSADLSTYWDLFSGNLIIRDGSTQRFTFARTTGNFTATGAVTANSFIKSGGTSSQFLKADGSVDSNTYWYSGNDGSGSGLDADLLRGVHWGNVNTNIITSGTATATNFILSSDERFKSNIKPIGDIWREFEMDGVRRYGVVAQEIEKTNPELVHTNEEGYKSVAYIDLLCKEMSEKDKKIQELESRLEKLEKHLKL